MITIGVRTRTVFNIFLSIVKNRIRVYLPIFEQSKIFFSTFCTMSKKLLNAYRKSYEGLCKEWSRRVYEYALLHRKDAKNNYLWYYVDKVAGELEYVVKNHRRGKRVWPLFRIVFYENGRRVHGSRASPIRIDLDRRRLKLRPLNVEVKLSSRLAEEFKEVLSMGCSFIAGMILRRRYAVHT